MSTTIEHQPVTEAVSLDDVKAHIRLTSTIDDAMVTRLAKAARIRAEFISRRSLVYKGYVFTMDKFPSPGQDIRLPNPPLITLSSILYLDSDLEQQTWDAAEYNVGTKQSPAIVRPKSGHVYPIAADAPDAVEVHFYAGYYSDGYGSPSLPLPEDLALAIAQLAGHWYDHPEAFSSETQNAVPENYKDIFRSYRVY